MPRVKVMPLQSGGEGYDALGHRVRLRPGFPAYLEADDAEARERDGEVMRLAGRSSRELKVPRAIAPEDLDSIVDEDPPERPAPPRNPPRKRRTYKRRDVVAEKPGSDG